MHHAMAVSSGVYTTMDVPTTPTSMRRTSAVGDESDVVLKHAILVDNSELSFTMQPHNGIPVEAWMSDPHDEALLDLLPLLDALRFVHDVRSVLGLRTGVFS
jgi:TFIIF-interacting CTD phosphatase-like protein